jgi:hypothetical protein
MRKLIAAAALLAVTSVNAAEELKFGDVNYFLKSGQINAAADVLSTYERSYQKSLPLRNENRGFIIDSIFSYAFTNQFNAFVGIKYAYDLESEDHTDASAHVADINNSGLGNPSLGANYRLFNQNEVGYNFDLGVVAKIGVQDAKRGTYSGVNSTNGNYADGRDSVELNARMGRKWNEANEWQVAAGVVYSLDGDYTLKTTAGNTKVDQDSSVDAYLRTTYQYRPVNEFMMLVSAQATQVGEAKGKVHGGVNTSADSHLDLDFRFTAKYLITSSFIGKFHYGMSHNADYQAQTYNTKGEITQRRENFFGLGVDFLF